MKRKLLCLLIWLGTYLQQSNAQLVETYGFKLAVTSASQHVEYALAADIIPGTQLARRLGINAGFFVEWSKSSIFTLLAQIEYTQRGFTQKFAYTGHRLANSDQRDSRIDYVSIPLFVKVSPLQGFISPYFLCGPRLDIRVGASDNMFGTKWITDHYNRSIWGLSAGIGVETHELLPAGLLLELRYNVDMTDAYAVNSAKARNNSFDLWMGVAF